MFFFLQEQKKILHEKPRINVNIPLDGNEKVLIFQAVGIVGAVIMPHNMYLHSALVKVCFAILSSSCTRIS